jgi:hypothetical protein
MQEETRSHEGRDVKVAKYTKEQREYAKTNGLHLVTVATLGVEYTGAVDRETARELLNWLTENVFKKPNGSSAAQRTAER